MKKYYFLAIFIWLSLIGYTQKKINPILIEGTKIQISATAETINRVTIKIDTEERSLEDYFEGDGYLITPFNEFTFRKKFKEIFIKKIEDQVKRENYIKLLGEEKFKKYISNKLNNKSEEDPSEKLKIQKSFNDRVSSIFHSINSQLISIFKYDNEPEAGILYYSNRPVTIQNMGKKREIYYIKKSRKLNHYFREGYKVYKKTKDEDEAEREIIDKSNKLITKDNFDEELKDKYKFFRLNSRYERINFFSNLQLEIINKREIDEIFSEENLSKLESSFNSINQTEKEIEKLQERKNEIDRVLNIIEKKKELEELGKQQDELSTQIESLTREVTNDLDFNYNNAYAYDYSLKSHILTKEFKEAATNKGFKIKIDTIENLLFNFEEKKNLYNTIINDIERITNAESNWNYKGVLIDDESILKVEKSEILSNTEELNSKTKTIEKTLKVSIDELAGKIKNKLPLYKYRPHKIQLDFNDGFVENMVIDGDIIGVVLDSKKIDRLEKIGFFEYITTLDWFKAEQLKFTIDYPLGFSSKNDFDDFKGGVIHSYDGKKRVYRMNIKDLIPNYIQTLQNDRLNYSPKNDTVILYPTHEKETIKSRVLKKEKTSKLFNLGVYSDFIGLNEASPNGLLQFEGNKLIPLYTKKKLCRGKLLQSIDRSLNYGRLNYINPQVRWSRLSTADNDKNLILRYQSSFNGSETERIPFVTMLDLLRYENFSIGGDLNLMSLGLPTLKVRFEANASTRYGRTKILDTNGEQLITSDENNQTQSNIRREFQTNTWRFYPEFIIRLRPEERYGATVAFRPMYFDTRTTNFSSISSEKTFIRTLKDDPQWLHQVAIDAYFSPSGRLDDRFFFRYRLTNNARWEYNGFSEIQVGYTVSLKF